MGIHVIENKGGEAVNLIPLSLLSGMYLIYVALLITPIISLETTKPQKHIMYPAAPDEPMKVMSVADNPTL